MTGDGMEETSSEYSELEKAVLEKKFILALLQNIEESGAGEKK